MRLQRVVNVQATYLDKLIHYHHHLKFPTPKCLRLETVLPPADTSSSLPLPSSSHIELPDNSPSPADLPSVLITRVCTILITAQTKKSVPTKAMYMTLFETLDKLGTLLDLGNLFDTKLKAFKNELVANLNSTIHHASPPSELTIALNKPSDIPSLPVPEIKVRVEAALIAANIAELQGITLCRVKVLSRNHLAITADTDKAALLLRQLAALWVPKLEKNSVLVTPRCQIVIDGVPMSFNPSSPNALLTVYAHNNAAISDPSCIFKLRWINPKALKTPGKKASSLLITFSDPLSGDLCIAQGVAMELIICYAHRYKGPLHSVTTARAICTCRAPARRRALPVPTVLAPTALLPVTVLWQKASALRASAACTSP
ncbi:hypothetical protein C8J57DRAFT_1517766 [Mycena rebaudengoi]|nr:hypothetical protein C8J57DRAFT_1517766 [Mycena rebaudengoi]